MYNLEIEILEKRLKKNYEPTKIYNQITSLDLKNILELIDDYKFIKDKYKLIKELYLLK